MLQYARYLQKYDVCVSTKTHTPNLIYDKDVLKNGCKPILNSGCKTFIYSFQIFMFSKLNYSRYIAYFAGSCYLVLI